MQQIDSKDAESLDGKAPSFSIRQRIAHLLWRPNAPREALRQEIRISAGSSSITFAHHDSGEETQALESRHE